MMEEKKENDFKMDTEDLRLLNAFGEALGDLPSEEETRAGCGLPALQLPS